MKTTNLNWLVLLVAVLAGSASAQIYDTNNVVVQTFVGSGFYGYVDGVGQQTMFYNPKGVVADSSGNLFVLDTSNARIRKVTPDGTVTTFAGGGTAPAGAGTNLSLSYGTANSIAIDHTGTLWIPESGGYLVQIGSNGFGRTFFVPGTSSPWGACVDSQNNVYISDSSANKIWRYGTNGVLEVFAGSGNPGTIDGNGIFDSFYAPTAIACDAADNIYVFDSSGYTLRRINQNRDVTTIAGGSFSPTDGLAPKFNPVIGMCSDGAGGLILACGSCVRKLLVASNSVTLAGIFSTSTAFANGSGIQSRFSGASGVCLLGGTIYVADPGNQRIRQINFSPSPQTLPDSSLALATYPGLKITGAVGRTYQVQASSDMATWSTLATVLLTSSPYLWIDQNPVGGRKFYRAVLLP